MMKNLESIRHKIVVFEQQNTETVQHAVARLEGKVVFTNGCFDLVHTGHIDYLSKAADLGDCFVIGLNSDESVKQLKGPKRPVKDEMNRALLLASFFFVDLVIVFGEETPYKLLQTVKPDVLVKGGDYDPSITDPSNPLYIVGSDLAKETKVIPFVDGYSSTNLINKMNS